MGKYDIYIALEWISWRLSPPVRKYSKGYIDSIACKVLQEAATSVHTAEDTKKMAIEGIQKAENTQALGTADIACNTMCKAILRAGKEEDFLEMLSASPRKITEWRKLWDAFRAIRPKIRRI